jgi:hypothetical protein
LKKNVGGQCFLAKKPLATLGNGGQGIFLIFLKRGIGLKNDFESCIYMKFFVKPRRKFKNI